MKMHDLSREQDDITADGPKIFKPLLQLSAKQLPGLAQLNINDRITIQVTCTIGDIVPPDSFDSRTSGIFSLICDKGVIVSKQKQPKDRSTVTVVDGMPRPPQGSTPPDSGQFGGGF